MVQPIFNVENKSIVTTVYKNNLDQAEILDDRGFSCVVQYLKGNMIFDTGDKHQILKNNIKKLNIDPPFIDYLVVSHKHWDHKGGTVGYWSKIQTSAFMFQKRGPII